MEEARVSGSLKMATPREHSTFVHVTYGVYEDAYAVQKAYDYTRLILSELRASVLEAVLVPETLKTRL